MTEDMKDFLSHIQILFQDLSQQMQALQTDVTAIKTVGGKKTGKD